MVSVTIVVIVVIFFFKQKTAYELRISDWSSDVCSSDLERVREDWCRSGIPQGRDRDRSLLQRSEREAEHLPRADHQAAVLRGEARRRRNRHQGDRKRVV